MIAVRHVAAGLIAALLATPSVAQQTVKIGLLVPLTGPFTPTGKQLTAGAKLYMQQHGDTVAGKKIELIIKDDGAVPDNTKRLAQELIVNDKVSFLAGFGVTAKPTRKFTLSRTISSCASRLELSATAPSSLTISSIFLPATVSPCCCM